MYFDEPQDNSPIIAPTGMRVMLSVNALGLLALGLMPQFLMGIAAYAIFNSI
jgi:NADH-quinone oxidoreductase subunit N